MKHRANRWAYICIAKFIQFAYKKVMTPVKHIRTAVLNMTQIQLAKALGTTQASVSRWETEGVFPPWAQPKVRTLAPKDRWSDTLFFEVPQSAGP